MSARKKISQRAALRMRKELRELRERIGEVCNSNYSGMLVSAVALSTKEEAETRTAAKLGYLLVLRGAGQVFAIDKASLR